jgi:hypothetical protein
LPLARLVQITGLSTGSIAADTHRVPLSIRQARLGSWPSLSRGSMTVQVAPSSPMIRSLMIVILLR